MPPPPPPLPVTRSEAGSGGRASSPRPPPVAKWPQAICTVCLLVMHWRQMEAEKVWLHWQHSKDDEEDSWEWKRTCIPCVAKRDGLTEEEAKLKVLSKPMEHKLARGNQLKEAKELDREKIEAMDGASRSKVRGVLKSTMIELFGPLAKFILRKRAALELVRVDVARHDELVRKRAQC